MKQRLLLAGASLALMSIGSCAPSAQGYRIATDSEPDGVGALALMQGVLDGRVNPDGTACLWVGDGRDGTAIIWPYGFYADGSPLAVFDSAGHKLVEVGRRMKIGGGLEPASVHSILGCSSFANYWSASGPPEEI